MQTASQPSLTTQVQAQIAMARELIEAEDAIAALRATLGSFAESTPQFPALAAVVAKYAENDGVKGMAQALRTKTTTEAQIAAQAEEQEKAKRRENWEAAVAAIQEGVVPLHQAVEQDGAVALEVPYFEIHSKQTRRGFVRVEFKDGAMTIKATAPHWLLGRYGKTQDGREKLFTVAPPEFTATGGPQPHDELRAALKGLWTYEERQRERKEKVGVLRDRSQELQAEEKARVEAGTAKTMAQILAGEPGAKVWVNPRVPLFHPDGKPMINRQTGERATAVMTYHLTSDGTALTLVEVVAFRVPDELTGIIGKPVPLSDLGKPEHVALKRILDNRSKYEELIQNKIAAGLASLSETPPPTASPAPAAVETPPAPEATADTGTPVTEAAPKARKPRKTKAAK